MWNLIITTIEPNILEVMLPLVLKWTYYQENKACEGEWNLFFLSSLNTKATKMRHILWQISTRMWLEMFQYRKNLCTELKSSSVGLDLHTDHERSSELSAVIHPNTLTLWAMNLPALRRQRRNSVQFCSSTFRTPVLFRGSVWLSCL